MSINLDDSIDALILALAASVNTIEAEETPFVLEQDSEPTQIEWEAAWVAAGNTLPIAEDRELYWLSGGILRGQFGRTNDRFYAIFPSNLVTAGGVTHFAFTKFLGWEDEQHFLFSGTILRASGVITGLLRGYMDGSLEQVTFVGFTANTLLGFDEAQSKLWYIQGTDLKRIDTNTSVITVIAAGITVAPTAIAFDGAGDAFCTINIGAGLDVYRWNNTGATFTSVKASITVNGVVVDPGQVITASLNYVVVNTAVANYWVQFARVGGAEIRIKSNPAGATAPNIPQPDATAWVQVFAGRSLDVLSIVYAELTGTPSVSEWRRTVLWNMATGTYSEVATLPYEDFITMCITQAPNPEPVNYDARRDVIYHTLTSAYRKRVSTAWEYHNISGIRPNNTGTRQILETDDGQVFVWSDGSSGKVWRISAWDYGEADAVILDIVTITGDSATAQMIDISDRPKGYNIIELSINNAVTAADTASFFSKKVGAANNNRISRNDLTPAGTATTQGAGGVRVETASWSGTQSYPFYDGVNSQSLARAFFILPDGDPDNIGGVMMIAESMAAEAGVSHYGLHVHFLSSDFYPMESVGFGYSANRAWLGQYIMVRALRSEGRRHGGGYYDPAMA